MAIKQHSNMFLAVKSKGSLSKFQKSRKAFERIRALNLIDDEMYMEAHPDCREQKMDPAIHYIYYGFKDHQKPYVNPVFDIEFYKGSYDCEDPIIDYVSEGFFKQNHINPMDCGYVDSLEEDISEQFHRHQNHKIQVDIDSFNFISDRKTTIPYIESSETFKDSRIRVGVFIKDPVDLLAPCPYIRIYEPLKKLSQSGKYTFFLYGTGEYPLMDLENILERKQFDIIVVQRILPFLHILLKKAKEHDIRIVYETDDDMLGVEPNSPSFSYVEKYRDSTERFIDSADVVTVSTPVLASKFKNKRVEVIRNYLVDFLGIKNEINRNSKVKLGYYGTLTHSKDIALLENVMKRLRKKYDFDFEIIGGFNQEDYREEDWYTLVPLPEYHDDFKRFMEWFKKNADWDIGLVPLEDSQFNSCKSELKFIELTALGIPGIYSDVNVYSSVVEDSHDGILAGSEDEWVEKIEMLMENEDLREKIVENATEKLLDSYLLEDRVDQWDKILSDLYYGGS